MITDISSVNSKVQITEGANHPHVYSVSDDHDYYFDADSVLRLIIRSTTYTIAFANLTIGGSAPANIGAAYTSLASVFPNANSGSGGSGGVTDITYAALVTAINASGLTAGAQYKITDYATKHYIVDASGTQYLDSIITGVNEPLTVTASSSSTLEPVAYSALHPEDIIHYDFNPANWLDDFSFNNAGVIITGFKGVIYFRHDTLLDNYMGYDFRNCKFRRWKTNVPAWNIGTTYNAGDYVNQDNFIYKSLTTLNVGNAPAYGSAFWIPLLDLSLTEYWNNNSTSQNGIVSGADFIDVKTFAEGVGSATYELCCRSNHFKGFKDSSNFDIGGTILSNNVFFLQDQNYFTVYTNEIGAENFGNTIADYFMYNTIGSYFNLNRMSGSFANNVIGSYFNSNVVGNSFIKNTIGNNFNNNVIGGGFGYNAIANNFATNILGVSFSNNTIGNNFDSNTIGNSFTNNTIGNGFVSCTIADYFLFNTVGNGCSSNIIVNSVTLADIKDGVSSINFSAATYIYQTGNKTVFKNTATDTKISYYAGVTFKHILISLVLF
jgi:hypothetical protein